MDTGDVIAERFEIDRLAGSGAMGSVYRARDLFTGIPVALKINQCGPEHAERFVCEARVLAELRHPGIVRFVSYGMTTDGDHYMAMEWLEGEDLEHRLEHSTLLIPEAVTLVIRAAEALAVAHAHGVVHRDIKPGNLYLPGGELERVKVLDFGIALLRKAGFKATEAEGTIGTPGYMAPEQAQGVTTIDARADVFALGCVLFECVTSKPAFTADSLVALLAKILLADVPRASELRSDVPRALDDLIARMLAKDPAERPKDCAEVAALLRKVGAGEEFADTQPSARPAALGSSEQRVLCVVVASSAQQADDDDFMAATLPPQAVEATREALRKAVEPFGASMEGLADGSAIVTLAGTGEATDLAAQAARCALAMHAVAPESSLALAIGRGVVAGRWPVGEVIDKAAAVMRAAQRAEAAPKDRQPVWVDEVAAGLLDARFDVRSDDPLFELRAEKDEAESSSRTLLGKTTPFVGRESVMAVLGETYRAASAKEARAVLVVAPEGTGKSRLRFEFVRQLAEGGEPPNVWIGRGDVMRTGSPFAMLAPAIRAVLGVTDGESRETAQAKIREHMARRIEAKEVDRIAEFIGELIGVPFPGEASVQLRSARKNGKLMADQVRRAWEDWLREECCDRPLLIVLDDLQWGDQLTVELIGAALRHLRERPLMVLALARPEVHELFPKLWSERGTTEVVLGELTPEACEKLAREVLGDSALPETIERVVAHAAGNAFFLEELIRAVAHDKTRALPGTVLAMVQTRIEALPPDARRVLRAGSVFGRASWKGGAMALLGGNAPVEKIDESLSILAGQEILARSGTTRFAGEEEYMFRHALLREAGYAMLTDNDRLLGHRLAGEWLVKAGEKDAIVLAQHFERGGEPGTAAEWYTRAAEQALDGNDLRAVLERAERGVTCGASGEVFGTLQLVKAVALRYSGQTAEAAQCASESMEWLPKGSSPWFRALGELADASGGLGDYDRLIDLVDELQLASAGSAVTGAYLTAASNLALNLLYGGRYEVAGPLIDWTARIAGTMAELDPAVAACIYRSRAVRALSAGDPGQFRELTAQAAAAFDHVGDVRSACGQRMNLGYASSEMGAYDLAASALKDALQVAERLGIESMIAAAKNNLGPPLARQGQLVEALRIESEAIETYVVLGNKRMEGGSRVYLADILLNSGDLDGAQREAQTAVTILECAPPLKVTALATLAQVLLHRGEATEALYSAREAMAILDKLGAIDEGESLTRLVYAEVLCVNGDVNGARASIRVARDRLVARAEKISDPRWRQSFLEQVPENARTIQLAQLWNVDGT